MPAFHHISLLTGHKHENVAFYTEILGLRFVKNTVNQDNHRMLHYYYGDYQGAPGTVVTFFIVPHLGHRYEYEGYLATIGLQIPRNSQSFWKERLKKAGVAVTESAHELRFQDPDDVSVILTETDSVLTPDHQVQNEIPLDKQITGLASTELHTAEPEKTSEFFQKLLGWETANNRIQFNENEALAIIPTNSLEKTRMGRGSIDHVAFAVKDESTLQNLYERAQAQNWEIEKVVSRGYFKSLYIREPGGHNRMEFATMSPGFTIDEPLETLGESFALPPFLAGQRAEIEANLYPDR